MIIWHMLFSWLLILMGSLLSLYGLYFVGVALLGFGAGTSFSNAPPTVRFAVIIPARNEEKVIGHLVDSLRKQKYPQGLVDIIVVPNHCTDRTAQAALVHGARIYLPQTTPHTKGDVLGEAINALLTAARHDAICVFDADNLVHPDFLQHMNDAYHQGVCVATSTRDSKNPTGSPTALGSSMVYWLLSRFYNKCREKLGLSCLVTGSGFMVTMAHLQRQGGWHTQTLTEDYEFSAQCVLAGIRVRYVAQAIVYDEQPIAFRQSWRQRRRWTTGYLQGMRCYLGRLLACGLRGKSKACLDMAMTFVQPVMMTVSLIAAVPGLALLWRSIGRLTRPGCPDAACLQHARLCTGSCVRLRFAWCAPTGAKRPAPSSAVFCAIPFFCSAGLS